MILLGMGNFEEKACLCALNRIFGFEPRTGLALISHFGGAKPIFEMDSKELESLTGPYFKYKGKISTHAVEKEAEELEKLARLGISFCGYTEEDYPELLKECDDPPIGIYIRSCTPTRELWKPRKRIAIVGTRDISPYGKEWCGRIVSSLAGTDAQPVIVSGLALGTDIVAHHSAIEQGLQTIAVMATGPETVYPARHRAFAERLAATAGCALISDYPPGTAPLAIHFLRRNRIIAGLSDATILVESRIKGGGMTTCRLAFSYSRDVYALPGRVDDVRSQGCNELIRRKIAEPLTSTQDLIEALGYKSLSKGTTGGVIEHILSAYQKHLPEERLMILSAILKLIRDSRGITLEDLAQRTGQSFKTIAELTGLLEIDGAIYIDLLQRCSLNYKNV